MSTRKLILAIGLFGVLGSASVARAQWVRLQRCNGAIPCMIPFAVRYRPDPLIAGQYGYMSPNSMSGRITLEPDGPAVHLDMPGVKLELPDFASEAARRIQLARPVAPPPIVEPPSTPRP